MPMNPYQGLKLDAHSSNVSRSAVTMPMNPYQGLKRWLAGLTRNRLASQCQ